MDIGVGNMPRRSEFVEHVVEMLRAFGPVEARSMFGGWGLYHRGVFFALVAQDTLYLKVDEESRPAFDAADLGPFVYTGGKDAKSIVMSYFRAPEEALESPEVMAEWARRGYGAALRAASRKASHASARAASRIKGDTSRGGKVKR